MSQTAAAKLPMQDEASAVGFKTTSLTAKLVCGSVAGVIGTLSIYPIDITKTYLQSSPRPLTGAQAVRDLIKKWGFGGLYRGLGANLVGIIPEKAIKLAVNDLVRERHARRLGVHPSDVPLLCGILAGASAGLCQVIATNPMEIVKIQMQIASEKGPRRGIVDVVRDLGVRGLYRGTPATLLRDVPFSVLFFPLFAFNKKLAAADQDNIGFFHVLGSGILAGAIAGAAVTPMDVVKTRLQAGTKPSSIRETVRHIYHTEGSRAFFAGTLQRSMIVAPLFGVTLLVYEVQRRYFVT